MYPSLVNKQLCHAVASSGGTMFVKDIVLIEIESGSFSISQVIFHMVVDDTVASCINVWGFEASPTTYTWGFQVRHWHAMFPLYQLRMSLMHSSATSGPHATVIIPFRYRGSRIVDWPRSHERDAWFWRLFARYKIFPACQCLLWSNLVYPMLRRCVYMVYNHNP